MSATKKKLRIIAVT